MNIWVRRIVITATGVAIVYLLECVAKGMIDAHDNWHRAS